MTPGLKHLGLLQGFEEVHEKLFTAIAMIVNYLFLVERIGLEALHGLAPVAS